MKQYLKGSSCLHLRWHFNMYVYSIWWYVRMLEVADLQQPLQVIGLTQPVYQVIISVAKCCSSVCSLQQPFLFSLCI